MDGQSGLLVDVMIPVEGSPSADYDLVLTIHTGSEYITIPADLEEVDEYTLQ